jgi:hypothetical protein
VTTPVDRDGITATVQPLGLALDVREYSITLDDSHTPYVEARLTCAAPDADDLDALDPRDELRVDVVLERELVAPVTGEQSRTLDLYLHERTLNAGDATIVLVCRSDEAIVIDDMLGGTTVDDSAEEFQSSLRDIVDSVLADFGAELEAGDADADYTITWDVTNLLPNPSAEVDTVGWLNGGSAAATLARSTVQARSGSASFRVQASSTVTRLGIFTDAPTISPPYPITVQAGKRYRFAMWVFTTLSGKSADARIRWASASADLSDSVGVSTPLTANTWTLVEVVATAPVGATNAAAFALATGSFAAGNQVFFDAGIFHDYDPAAPGVVEYFDGSTVDDYYTYAWTGTAHASSSTRTRNDSRSPDVLKRAPGVKAWDFLSPLVEAAGLRLFCDEQRRWWLVDPTVYTVEGSLRISEGFNATAASDTIDLSAADRGVPGYAETVVVKYTWTDADGVQQVAYDAAGEEHGIGRLVELDRPYPGPGYAAAQLRKSEGKGRTLDLEALTDLTATPGQVLVATIPGAPIQTGVVSSVEWRSEGEMRVGSRGLTDTPATAWALAEGTWDDVVGIPWNAIDEEGE